MVVDLRNDSIRIMMERHFDAKTAADFITEKYNVVVFQRDDFYEVRGSTSILYDILFEISIKYDGVIMR